MSNAKIIYIAGYGRSGSTILDTLIANCPHHFGMGEVSNIFDDYISGKPCSCGALLSECEFWGRYFKDVDVPRLAVEQRRCEGVLGPFFYRSSYAYKEFWKGIISDAEERGDVLADSSKISRKTAFRPLNLCRLGAQIVFVHVYKSPEMLLESLVKGSNKSLENGRDSAGLDHLFILRSYLGALFSSIMTLVFGKFFFGQYVRVSYTEIVGNPFGVLAKLGVNAGKYLDISSLDVGHAVSGNRLRRSMSRISLDQTKAESKVSRGDIPLIYRLLFSTLRIFGYAK